MDRQEYIRKLSRISADEIMDRLEWEADVKMSEDQWENMSQAIENDLAESITEHLAAL